VAGVYRPQHPERTVLYQVLFHYFDRINLHPHLHFLVTEGGADEGGLFPKIPRIDDTQLERLSFEKEGQVSYRYGCSYASLAPLSPPAAIFCSTG
jgi:hypothetical protein